MNPTQDMVNDPRKKNPLASAMITDPDVINVLEGTPKVEEAPEEGPGIIDYVAAPLGAAWDRLSASSQAILRDMARSGGNFDVSHYAEKRMRDNIASAQQAEKDFDTAQHLISGVAQAVPTAAATIAGTPALGAAVAGATAIGQSYGDIQVRALEENLDSPESTYVDPQTALLHAIPGAAVDVALGKLGGKAIDKWKTPMPVKAPIKDAATTVGVNAATGAISGAQQQALQNSAVGGPISDNVLESAAVGGLLTGGISTLGAAGKGLKDVDYNQLATELSSKVPTEKVKEVFGDMQQKFKNRNVTNVNDEFVVETAAFNQRAGEINDALNQEGFDPANTREYIDQLVKNTKDLGDSEALREAIVTADDFELPVTDGIYDFDINGRKAYDVLGKTKDDVISGREAVKGARPGQLFQRGAVNRGETQASFQEEFKTKGIDAMSAIKAPFANNLTTLQKYLRDRIRTSKAAEESGDFDNIVSKRELADLGNLEKILQDLSTKMQEYSGNKRSNVYQSIENLGEEALDLIYDYKLQNLFTDHKGNPNWNPLLNVKVAKTFDEMLRSQYPSVYQGAPDLAGESASAKINPLEGIVATGSMVAAPATALIAGALGGIRAAARKKSQLDLRKAKKKGSSFIKQVAEIPTKSKEPVVTMDKDLAAASKIEDPEVAVQAMSEVSSQDLAKSGIPTGGANDPILDSANDADLSVVEEPKDFTNVVQFPKSPKKAQVTEPVEDQPEVKDTESLRTLAKGEKSRKAAKEQASEKKAKEESAKAETEKQEASEKKKALQGKTIQEVLLESKLAKQKAAKSPSDASMIKQLDSKINKANKIINNIISKDKNILPEMRKEAEERYGIIMEKENINPLDPNAQNLLQTAIKQWEEKAVGDTSKKVKSIFGKVWDKFKIEDFIANKEALKRSAERFGKSSDPKKSEEPEKPTIETANKAINAFAAKQNAPEDVIERAYAEEGFNRGVDLPNVVKVNKRIISIMKADAEKSSKSAMDSAKKQAEKDKKALENNLEALNRSLDEAVVDLQRDKNALQSEKAKKKPNYDLIEKLEKSISEQESRIDQSRKELGRNKERLKTLQEEAKSSAQEAQKTRAEEEKLEKAEKGFEDMLNFYSEIEKFMKDQKLANVRVQDFLNRKFGYLEGPLSPAKKNEIYNDARRYLEKELEGYTNIIAGERKKEQEVVESAADEIVDELEKLEDATPEVVVKAAIDNLSKAASSGDETKLDVAKAVVKKVAEEVNVPELTAKVSKAFVEALDEVEYNKALYPNNREWWLTEDAINKIKDIFTGGDFTKSWYGSAYSRLRSAALGYTGSADNEKFYSRKSIREMAQKKGLPVSRWQDKDYSYKELKNLVDSAGKGEAYVPPEDDFQEAPKVKLVRKPKTPGARRPRKNKPSQTSPEASSPTTVTTTVTKEPEAAKPKAKTKASSDPAQQAFDFSEPEVDEAKKSIPRKKMEKRKAKTPEKKAVIGRKKVERRKPKPVEEVATPVPEEVTEVSQGALFGKELPKGAMTKEELDERAAKEEAKKRAAASKERDSKYPPILVRLKSKDALKEFDDLVSEGMSRADAIREVLQNYS